MDRRAAPFVAVVALSVIVGLEGCSAPRTTIVHDTRTVTTTPTAAPTVTETTTSTTTATPAPGESSSLGWRGNTRTAGCTDNGGEIPSGARSVSIADVDGDGQRDTLIIDGRHTQVGVLTHSGHLTMTRALWGAGPAAHSVAASYLSDGITALLADDNRTVELGYYVDCGIVQPKGVDGKQYTFALFGWGADGTGPDHVYNAGVRCTALADSGGQHTLSGVDLIKDQSLFRIRTTVVSTSDRGVTAVNGRVSTTPGAYGKDDSTAKRAETVDCAPRVSAPSE